MAGSGATLIHNAKDFAKSTRAIADRCGSMEPAMEIIGAHLVGSIQENFLAEGRPTGWAPLSPATLALKKNSNILRVHGMAGGLMGSINYQAGENVVAVGTNKVYGAIHNFGGKAGRGRKVTIPKREFLMVQDEDWAEIEEQLADFILEED